MTHNEYTDNTNLLKTITYCLDLIQVSEGMGRGKALHILTPLLVLKQLE